MPSFYLRNTCRLCDSKNIFKVLSLTSTALCDAYIYQKRNQEIYPLDLYLCNDCGFVQINCIVDPEIIYRDYIYVTTSSSGLNYHFENYAKKVFTNISLNRGDYALDIGSNDGTLLSYFKNLRCKVLGIEPSIKTAEDATNRGIETLPDFFNQQLADIIKDKYGTFNLITTNNLYANIDNLYTFTKAVETILKPDGVYVIESSYLSDMVDNMVFDFIYHEHLSYFSIFPLEKFFARFNMHLINIEHVDTKGGSLRYYWAKKSSEHKISSNVDSFRDIEKSKNINPNYFNNWNQKILSIRNDLTQFLEINKGKKIIGYGASATSTTLIYHYGLQNYISVLIDDNPGKINTYSPGLHIPVRSLKEVEFDQDTILIILAWRYEKQIISKLNNFKGKIVLPLPELKILG